MKVAQRYIFSNYLCDYLNANNFVEIIWIMNNIHIVNNDTILDCITCHNVS